MITISIVTYKHSLLDLESTLKSVEKISIDYKLFIIDNSPTDELMVLANDERVVYCFNDKNIGFGAAHNIAIKKAMEIGSKYHLVLNPDVYFDEGVLETIIEFMDSNIKVGLLMPEILYPNGEIQYLPKLLPTPWNMIKRKLPLFNAAKLNLTNKYELRFVKEKQVIEVPLISGCFSFFRTSIFENIGFYDDRFFMYFEDVDIARRVNKFYKTVFFQKASIYHCYERGAHKSWRLLFIFLMSFIRYFNKWGWIFDKDRIKVNKVILKNIK